MALVPAWSKPVRIASQRIRARHGSISRRPLVSAPLERPAPRLRRLEGGGCVAADRFITGDEFVHAGGNLEPNDPTSAVQHGAQRGAFALDERLQGLTDRVRGGLRLAKADVGGNGLLDLERRIDARPDRLRRLYSRGDLNDGRIGAHATRRARPRAGSQFRFLPRKIRNETIGAQRERPRLALAFVRAARATRSPDWKPPETQPRKRPGRCKSKETFCLQKKGRRLRPRTRPKFSAGYISRQYAG
jgi:hypothetical protein